MTTSIRCSTNTSTTDRESARKNSGRARRPSTPVAVVLFAAVFLVSGIPVDVHGQDVSEERLQQLEGHVQQASRFLDQEEYEAAIVEFENAREILDHPRLSVAIADAYLELERCSSAEEEYRILLEREDLGEERRDAVEQGLEEATEECVETAPLRVSCEPADAQLVVDGRSVACPFEEEVQTGTVELELTAPDYQARRETVEVQPEETTRIALDLQPVPEEPDDEPGPDWFSLTSYGAMGLGAALMIGGGLSDYGSSGRLTEMKQARDDGDQQRVQQLRQEARSARIRTGVLYGVGAAATLTGVGMFLYDFYQTEESSAEGLTMGIGPTGVSATVRW